MRKKHIVVIVLLCLSLFMSCQFLKVNQELLILSEHADSIFYADLTQFSTAYGIDFKVMEPEEAQGKYTTALHKLSEAKTILEFTSFRNNVFLSEALDRLYAQLKEYPPYSPGSEALQQSELYILVVDMKENLKSEDKAKRVYEYLESRVNN